jgi:hypothetical protein
LIIGLAVCDLLSFCKCSVSLGLGFLIFSQGIEPDEAMKLSGMASGSHISSPQDASLCLLSHLPSLLQPHEGKFWRMYTLSTTKLEIRAK